MKIIIFLAITFFTLYKWFKWWLASAVLAAWIAEKKYESPKKEDTERLSKWVIHKKLN
ncbi:MAG: hypothetical protein IJY55_01725 [Clostridia bacterium]|nr:hypothetical protein [Clostridia bacterium]